MERKKRFLKEINKKAIESFKNTLKILDERRRRNQTSLINDATIQLKKEYKEYVEYKSILSNTDSIERTIHIIKELLSDEYKVPKLLGGVAFHLNAVSMLYSILPLMDDVPDIVERKIDFAMVRLVKESMIDSFAYSKIKKDYFRTESSITAKRKTKADRKQPVLEEYHKIDTTGMSKNKIANTIKENLGKWRRDVPSLNTIKRYLEEEKLIPPVSG